MHLQLPARASHPRQPSDPDWQQALPAEWRTAALAPLTFAVHREYEIPASRIFGYDADGVPCYYRHDFVLGAPRSDDDEEFYEAVIYGEEVEAWRLRDERWLVWRIVRQGEDCGSPRGFYSFSERMPR
jgi:hypothetical protein